jgi:hypothetical protein
MPAMWSEARLAHVEGGMYRGSANMSMRGRWDVTVSATRAGREPAEHHTSLMVGD